MTINPGDQVLVKTKRGSLAIKVRSDKEIPEGMVFIPFCFAEAAANVLTNPQLDPIGKIPEFKFSAANVEKIQAAVNLSLKIFLEYLLMEYFLYKQLIQLVLKRESLLSL